MSDFLLGHIEHRSSSQNWQVRHFFRGYNFTEEVADRFFEYLDKARHRQTIVFLLDILRLWVGCSISQFTSMSADGSNSRSTGSDALQGRQSSDRKGRSSSGLNPLWNGRTSDGWLREELGVNEEVVISVWGEARHEIAFSTGHWPRNFQKS